MTDNIKISKLWDNQYNCHNQYNHLIFPFVLVCFYDEPIL